MRLLASPSPSSLIEGKGGYTPLGEASEEVVVALDLQTGLQWLGQAQCVRRGVHIAWYRTCSIRLEQHIQDQPGARLELERTPYPCTKTTCALGLSAFHLKGIAACQAHTCSQIRVADPPFCEEARPVGAGGPVSRASILLGVHAGAVLRCIDAGRCAIEL